MFKEGPFVHMGISFLSIKKATYCTISISPLEAPLSIQCKPKTKTVYFDCPSTKQTSRLSTYCKRTNTHSCIYTTKSHKHHLFLKGSMLNSDTHTERQKLQLPETDRDGRGRSRLHHTEYGEEIAMFCLDFCIITG